MYSSKENENININWKCIWKKYCLQFGNEKLLNEKQDLKSYGIENGSELKFVKFFKRRRDLKPHSTFIEPKKYKKRKIQKNKNQNK